MARHKCGLDDCDGTKLGHELARDFPAETRAVTEGLERLIDAGRFDFTVNPGTLTVSMADVMPPEPPLLCPECAQGKPGNCVGQALDPETDEFVDCEGGS